MSTTVNLVWRDLNGDGVSTAQELSTLDMLGITRISLAANDNAQRSIGAARAA